jgi:hypothetical protein
MPYPNSEKRDFSKFDEMATDVLEQLLRQDFELTETDETDMDAILYIMEVVAKRKKGSIPDTKASWTSFLENYVPSEEQDVEAENTICLNKNDEIQKGAISTPYQKMRPSFRKVIYAAAVIAIMFVLMIGAQALGIDVLGALATWTDETFNFQSIGRGSDSGVKSALSLDNDVQLAFSSNFPAELLPTWIPEGYGILESKSVSNSFGIVIKCSFINGDKQTFYIQYDYFEDSADLDQQVYEKDAQQVEIYCNRQWEFYIFSNMNDYTATWSDGKMCMSIIGCNSVEIIKGIIDSLGGN